MRVRSACSLCVHVRVCKYVRNAHVRFRRVLVRNIKIFAYSTFGDCCDPGITDKVQMLMFCSSLDKKAAVAGIRIRIYSQISGDHMMSVCYVILW